MNCTISSFCTLLLRRIHKDEESKEKSNSLKLFMPAILFAIVTTASLLVGCSDSTGNRSFSSSDEAVKDTQPVCPIFAKKTKFRLRD